MFYQCEHTKTYSKNRNDITCDTRTAPIGRLFWIDIDVDYLDINMHVDVDYLDINMHVDA